MNNPIKQMGITLAAALVMAVGMNCAGASKQQPTTTGRQTAAPVQPSGSGSPPASAPAAPVAPTATVDELDIAIRDASDYLNDNIPQRSKIVILNIESNSTNLSEYLIDELIANAVNDKNFSVVDRRQLETIQSEQKFQMSGAVDDKDALAIGKFFGAQTIISGTMRDIGGRYRMTIRALSVQTAQVQGQYNRNMVISETLAGLANSGSGWSRPSVASTTTSGGTTQTTFAPTRSAPATPPIQGIAVPGNSLTEKLAWLQRSAESHETYIIEAKANENIAPYTFEYRGGINITIALKGDNVNRTIRLSSNGAMFTVRPNVTFILENNITLQGHNGNNNNIVNVEGGTFRMNTGSAIIGNSSYGGVYVGSGTFEMTDGIISGNGRSTSFMGGGVDVRGTFNMSGGTITGNTASKGGGVYVNGTFNMTGGNISGNRAAKGGGVYRGSRGKFTMRGGTVAGNTANENGGGICVEGGYGAVFTKTGGIITGYKDDQSNGNVVRDFDGVLARKGHAVYIDDVRRKEATAGTGVNLSSDSNGIWDQ